MPNDAKLNYCLAYQYQMLKDWKNAASYYEKCLDLYPYFLKAYLQLGQIFEDDDRPDRALEVYRNGVRTYRKMKPSRKNAFASVGAKIYTRAANLIKLHDNATESTLMKIEFCFTESVACEPENADNSYRLGRFLLENERIDEALKFLKRAHSLAPHKEYISHKIAQAHLQKGNSEKAFMVYEKIPVHKRSAYILNGMATCLRQQGKIMEAVQFFYRATLLESGKFYHYRDLGNVLMELGDRDQAIKILEKANELFKKEHDKDHNKIIATIDVAKTMEQENKIVLEEPDASVSTIGHGSIIKYISERGFGFIKDDNDGDNIFFHIKNVKPRTTPEVGMSVRFLKEIAEKGPFAPKVWLNKERN